MEVRNFFLDVSGMLQTPFDTFHAQVSSPTEYNMQNVIIKVVWVAAGIVLYPVFGALSLIGRVIDWIIYQTAEAAPMHEKLSSGDETDYQSYFTQYQEATQKRLKERIPARPKALTMPSREVLEVIQKAGPTYPLPDGVKRFGGYETCITYDRAPDVVFKLFEARENAYKYVDCAKRARELCNQEGLFLLQVPSAIVAQLPNGQYTVLQEKVAINGHFYYQRGLYRSLLADPGSQEYMKELFRQMAIFIAKFKFSDVKYDNFPITKEGSVALFDLDEKSAVTGFLKGGSKKVDGILSDLKPEMQAEILEVAKPHLTPDEYEKISKEMPTKKALTEKRWKKIDAYYKYASEHAITTPQQKIKTDQFNLCGLGSKERTLALTLLEKINAQHQEQKDWIGLRMARLVCLETRSFNGINYLFSDLESSLNVALEHLKKIGAIHAFKINLKDNFVKVYS